MKKQVVVIGLGRFGVSVATTLFRVKSYFSHLFRTYSEAGIKQC